MSRQAANQSQGIQTLLEAEKEAAKIVQKARTCACALEGGGNIQRETVTDVAISPILYLFISYSPSVDRTQKLKDARSEAAKEIDDVKSKKEKEFQSFQKEVRRWARLACSCIWRERCCSAADTPFCLPLPLSPLYLFLCLHIALPPT